MIELIPPGRIDGKIIIPGSKYVANRALIIAALADGTSVLKNVPDNDDISAAIKALGKLGVNLRREDSQLTIQGVNGQLQGNTTIDVSESGTLLRFITAAAVLADGKVTITGSQRIRQRPVGPLVDGLTQLGVEISCDGGKPPLDIAGGWLRGGTALLDGSVSSQFISALLLVSPFAGQDVNVIVPEELVSKQYVDMTVQLMEAFGVRIQRQGYRQFTIKAGQRYRAKTVNIAGDWSSANYFFAAAAITGGKVRVCGLDTRQFQGEAQFVQVLADMGCIIDKQPGIVTVTGADLLKGVDIDMSSMPDAVQTFVAVAVFADSPSSITGIDHLVHKESDRINDTIAELAKIGIRADKTDGGMRIHPGDPDPAVIDPHNDHRMAMSFALLGLRRKGVRIGNPDCVRKSFPGFWEAMRGLGVELHED